MFPIVHTVIVSGSRKLVEIFAVESEARAAAAKLGASYLTEKWGVLDKQNKPFHGDIIHAAIDPRNGRASSLWAYESSAKRECKNLTKAGDGEVYEVRRFPIYCVIDDGSDENRYPPGDDL